MRYKAKGTQYKASPVESTLHPEAVGISISLLHYCLITPNYPHISLQWHSTVSHTRNQAEDRPHRKVCDSRGNVFL